MKGVTGNLGMDKLYELCSQALVEAREGKMPSNLRELKETYQAVVQVLSSIP